MADALYNAILGETPKSNIAFSDDELDRLKSTESSGNPFAVNKDTGAMGAYQFMPATVAQFHEKGIKFNPFDEKQSREIAKNYLNDLATKLGSKEKALAAYGGFVTKDPTSYVNKVLSGEKPKEAASNDPLYNAIMGVESKTQQPVQQAQTQETKPSMMETMNRAMKTNAPIAENLASLGDVLYGAVPSTVGAVTYAGGRALGQTPEEASATSQKVAGAISQPFGKALGVTETAGYKNEGARQIMDKIGQYIGESADVIAQKTGLPKSDVENMLGTLGLVAGKGMELGGKAVGTALKAREVAPSELPQFRGGVTAEQMGQRNVGASETTKATVLQDALSRATPELAAELKNVNPADVNTDVLNRHIEADSLPVPIRLTKGQATQDPTILSNEINSRGKNKELADRYNEQNHQLIENINAINENAAPNVFGTNHVENGQALIDSYLDIDNARKADITAKYDALKEAAGGEIPIDGAAFANNAFKSLKKDLKSDFLATPIQKQLERYQSGEPMTFEQFEALRTNLASEMRRAARAGDGNAEAAASIVRNALEELPLTGETAELKGLADEARSAAKKRFNALKSDKAYNAAVNGSVASDDFIQKYVVNGKKNDIDIMINQLGADSQAREVMAAGIINWLKSKAGIVNEQGNFSQAGFNKALQNIDPKILTIVGPQVNAQLKALGNTARLTQARPKGSFVNESNTFVAQAGELAKSGAEKTANYVFGANIVPVGTIAREALGKRATKQATRESLKPGAGTKISDIGK
jgi:hypothetical protein